MDSLWRGAEEEERDRLSLSEDDFGVVLGELLADLEGARPDVLRVDFAWADGPLLLPLPETTTFRDGGVAIAIPFEDGCDATGPVRARLCLASER